MREALLERIYKAIDACRAEIREAEEGMPWNEGRAGPHHRVSVEIVDRNLYKLECTIVDIVKDYNIKAN